MRKHSAAESAHRSESPIEKKRRVPHKKETKGDSSPELSPADRFMADTKEYMRLKERHAKLSKEIDSVREAGLTLSAVEKSITQEDLPELEATMTNIAQKYGAKSDRFKEDAEQVHNAELAAKKLEDKKEKAILRSQISDIAAKFVRGDEKPPALPHKTFTKPKTDVSEVMHPQDSTWEQEGRENLSKMTDNDIDRSVNDLDEKIFTPATERPIVGVDASFDTADSVIDEIRTLSQELYTGDATKHRITADKETTTSAMAEIHKIIEDIPVPTKPDQGPFTKDHFIPPPPMPKESWPRAEIRRAEEEMDLDSVASRKADLAEVERRILNKFKVDPRSLIAEEKKGFWKGLTQRAKTFWANPNVSEAMKEYRLALKNLEEAEKK